MGTRSGKLIVNSVYSVVAWMAPLLMAFLATPFVLKRIGTEVYGVYLVVLGFIGYSFTFNAARAVAKFVAELRGSQKRSEDQLSSNCRLCPQPFSRSDRCLHPSISGRMARWRRPPYIPGITKAGRTGDYDRRT